MPEWALPLDLRRLWVRELGGKSWGFGSRGVRGTLVCEWWAEPQASTYCIAAWRTSRLMANQSPHGETSRLDADQQGITAYQILLAQLCLGRLGPGIVRPPASHRGSLFGLDVTTNTANRT